ncbi:tyrosine-type recombinase/integrase [Bosea sp. NBC_00550]|uniref:tyrosine-type recombinase/integrase n=1 Tax=Bosea sp. NBC_00550 TaxID=2969621 RepID=UPI002232985D|nr:site-specific integrase [Bosea sp. NBC_00550]UZF92952.1 site-specific integrase [Bosea sp. NBC_00550]
MGQLAVLYACIRNGAVKPEEAYGGLALPWLAKRPESAQGSGASPQQRPSKSGLSTFPAPPNEKASLTSICQDWWEEAKAAGRKPSTHESYKNTTSSLVTFLGHDDASRVTPDDIVDFKDYRLSSINPRTGKPISAKTVKDSDLSGLKTLFGWAVSNRRMPSNPTHGITIKLGKRKITRSKGFTDDEAEALLKAADALTPGNEQPKTFDAKRWIPWLCAYTGARVGELCQLRKQDLKRVGSHWVIHISPEAGTVKTDEARDVVMHEHLVAKGFPEFVQGCKVGHLFLKPAQETGDVLGPLQGVKNRLAEEARETVKDTRVMPNHGWRHRFKTVARSVGMDGRVVDAIQGHAPRTAGDDYGDVTVEAMALAIAKFPRQIAREEATGA